MLKLNLFRTLRTNIARKHQLLANLDDDEIPGSQGDFLSSFDALVGEKIDAVVIRIAERLRLARKVKIEMKRRSGGGFRMLHFHRGGEEAVGQGDPCER